MYASIVQLPNSKEKIDKTQHFDQTGKSEPAP